MPKRATRERRRGGRFLSALIVLCLLAIAALASAIALRDRGHETDVAAEAGGDYVRSDQLPDTEVVLKADTFKEEYLSVPDVQAATATPTPSPTPAPTIDISDPNAALRPVALSEDLLPVFSRAYTKERVIAITLDELSGAAITDQFLDLAARYEARLTLFPTGENLMKRGMDTVLKKALFQLGFEIENRGYSTISRLFQAPSQLLVQEIWKQSMALNYVLDVKYEPHFLRLYGGVGEYDPRTHAYLKQEGYLGIAHWTVSGTDTPIEELEGKLTPGGIYIFKTTQEDLQRMEVLMKAAMSFGYRMVTMNELFGYEANSYYTVEGSLLSETMPDFDYDDAVIYDVYPGESSWAVVRIQERLGVLGYMVGQKADGIFGEATAEALRQFQVQVGRPASGVGDTATLRLLFSDDAPYNPAPTPTPTPGYGWMLEEGELAPSENFDDT